MPRKLLNKSTKKRIISKYKKGSNMKTIAVEVGCAPETVRRVLMNDGTVTIRPRGKSSITPVSSSNSPNKKDILIGSSPKKNPVATISKQKVFKKKKNGPGLENACKPWSNTEDEVLMDALGSGMGLKDLASLLGRTKIAVSGRKYILTKRGIIAENDTRFPRADGTTYNKTDAEIIETVPAKVNVEGNTSVMMNVNLSDIAQVVRDYGVSASISINIEGTKIDITT